MEEEVSCHNCNKLIFEGHVLDYGEKYAYYCDEKCLKEDNLNLKSMSMSDMYDEEIQYYTTWYDGF